MAVSKNTCYEVVNIDWLKSLVGSAVQDADGNTVSVDEKSGTTYCPTYKELTNGTFIPYRSESSDGPASDTDGITVNKKCYATGEDYADNQLVNKHDVAVCNTRLKTFTISIADASTNISGCSGGTKDLSYTRTFTRNTWDMLSCSTQTESSHSTASTADTRDSLITWRTNVGSISNKKLTVGKNTPSTSGGSTSRTITVTGSSTFRGTTSTPTASVTQNGVSGTVQNWYTGETSQSDYKIVPNKSTFPCTGGSFTVTASHVYKTRQYKHWVDECNVAYNSAGFTGYSDSTTSATKTDETYSGSFSDITLTSTGNITSSFTHTWSSTNYSSTTVTQKCAERPTSCPGAGTTYGTASVTVDADCSDHDVSLSTSSMPYTAVTTGINEYNVCTTSTSSGNTNASASVHVNRNTGSATSHTGSVSASPGGTINYTINQAGGCSACEDHTDYGTVEMTVDVDCAGSSFTLTSDSVPYSSYTYDENCNETKTTGLTSFTTSNITVGPCGESTGCTTGPLTNNHITYTINQNNCVADCPAQSDVVFLPSYSNYEAGTVDNLLAFNSGNTKFSSIKSLSLTSGDWLSNVDWSSKYKDGDTAWPFIKFTQTENTSTTTDRTGVITVVMNAANAGECSFPITVTQGKHTSICPSFEDVVADGNGQPITGVTVPNTSTGCTTGCTGFLWFKTGDTAFSSTGSVTPDGTVITGASFGNSTTPGYCFITLKFRANDTTTDKNGSVTIKMNATNGDECSYTVPITLKGLPVSVITYSASTKLDVNLNDFTPAATAETFSNGVGKIEFDAVVTGIGENAFYVKSALTGIDIPDSVTSIGNYAFANCHNLKEITIPSGVIYINDYLLYGCTSLSSVTIQRTFVEIKQYAIADCPGLRKIELPNAVAYPLTDTTSLNNSADCPIYVPEEYLVYFWGASSTDFPYKDRVLVHAGDNCVVYKASAKLTGNIGNAYSSEYKSSSTKLSILSHTYDSSKMIGKITYNSSVVSFHDGTFDTAPIDYIALPEHIKRIGQEVFVSSNLISIYFPDSVVGLCNSPTDWGSEVLHNCRWLKTVVAGTGLTQIGYSCFTCGDEYSSLTGITFYSTTPPTLDHKNTFEHTIHASIYVPCGQVSTYKSANIWNDSDIKNKIKAIPPCTS